tara:strand:+ start:317 stop:751 length:435 start_codon:yes stop_codon:yes gene_type:complete
MRKEFKNKLKKIKKDLLQARSKIQEMNVTDHHMPSRAEMKANAAEIAAKENKMTDQKNGERDELARGYQLVDRQLVPMTEEESDDLEKDMENLNESGDVNIDPSGLSDDDFIDEEKPQPMPEIQKEEEGVIKFMGRICNFLSRK